MAMLSGILPFLYVLSVCGLFRYTIPKLHDARASVRAQQSADCVSCVACHPSQPCIATGMHSGRILYWWALESQSFLG